MSDAIYSLITGYTPLVNVDVSPTQLFLNIQSLNWLECINRAESHPDEVRTWVYRQDPDSHLDRLWVVLPIHAALLFQSPACVVNMLLKIYPECAKQRDGNNNLPLHIALKYVDPDHDILHELIRLHPTCIYEENKNNGMSLADYDLNCPWLYKLIQRNQWKEARRRTKYYSSEARTWIIKRGRCGKIKWRHLPIHAAVSSNAPVEVINYLLKVFPESAKYVDDQGMIPLERELEKPKRKDSIINSLSKALAHPQKAISYTEGDANEHKLTDHDKNCTILYKLIEQKDWQNALNRIISHPEETQIWVMKQDDDEENGAILWRRLPIHTAIILKASPTIIEMLLTAHLESIRCCDDQGRLPFQIALDIHPQHPQPQHESSSSPTTFLKHDICNLLLEALENPDSICVRDPQSDVFLMNYDTSLPDQLYRLIESSLWNETIDRARSYPEEARIWFMRKHSVDGTLAWRRLPLHAAVMAGRDCPREVVEVLLEVYVEGAMFRDDRGLLPLQLARWRGCCGEGVVELLRRAYPQGATLRDPTSEIALDYSPTARTKNEVKSGVCRGSAAMVDKTMMSRGNGAGDIVDHGTSLFCS